MSARYEDVLKLLLPAGINLSGTIDDDLAVEGRSLDSSQARAEALLDEIFADNTHELLADWERVCGLTPAAGDPMQVRVDRVVRQLRALGDVKKPYFVALAAGMGYTITIEDYLPFMAGWGRAGDAIYEPEVIHIWKVSVTGQPSYCFRAGQSSAGEPLSWFEPAANLENLMNDLKPAEVFLHFVYP